MLCSRPLPWTAPSGSPGDGAPASAHKRIPPSDGGMRYGWMFWFMDNRLSGSHCRFAATNLSQLGP